MEKKEIRTLFNKKRLELSSENIHLASKQIFNQLTDNFELKGKNISVFIPIERFKEVNTWEIIENVDATFILPVIRNNDLVHIIYEGKDQLEVSDWGIPEPAGGVEVDPSEIDIVLVPLLAVDESGNRVGYGKGFYDRFLASCSNKCQFIGLSLFDPIDKIDDTHEGDKPIHFLVTPKAVRSF